MMEVEPDGLTLIFRNMVYVTEMLRIIDLTVTRWKVIRLKCHHAESGYSCGGAGLEVSGYFCPFKSCFVHQITLSQSSIGSLSSFLFGFTYMYFCVCKQTSVV